MLKKMRIKFVIVVMAIVTVLFGAIFYSIIHFTKENLERESIEMMRMAAFSPPSSVPSKPNERHPDKKPHNTRNQFFRIEQDNENGISTFGSDYYDLSDEKCIESLIDIVNSNTKETGIISEANLRYMKNITPRGISITFADITSEKMMINKLIRNSVFIGSAAYLVFFGITLLLAKWVTKPVENAWNEQKQFVADASHELKTPLTVIMTNAEMLTGSEYSEKDKSEFTKNILSMSHRMRGLVENLLELARMDIKSAVRSVEKLNFSKLVLSCTLPFEPLFYEKDMELDVNVEKELFLEGDKDSLKQVVDILLDNALKYSNKSVNISLKNQGNHIVLSVSGNGNALSKEECKNIFKRFYRADDSRNDSSSYGLGLSIAEGIVNSHNGKIWAESENGKNTFYVML